MVTFTRNGNSKLIAKYGNHEQDFTKIAKDVYDEDKGYFHITRYLIKFDKFIELVIGDVDVDDVNIKFEKHGTKQKCIKSVFMISKYCENKVVARYADHRYICKQHLNNVVRKHVNLVIERIFEIIYNTKCSKCDDNVDYEQENYDTCSFHSPNCRISGCNDPKFQKLYTCKNHTCNKFYISNNPYSSSSKIACPYPKDHGKYIGDHEYDGFCSGSNNRCVCKINDGMQIRTCIFIRKYGEHCIKHGCMICHKFKSSSNKYCDSCMEKRGIKLSSNISNYVFN